MILSNITINHEYSSREQEVVCESRKAQGYDVFPCHYMGRTNVFCATKGRHTLVVNTDGYDIYVPRGPL